MIEHTVTIRCEGKDCFIHETVENDNGSEDELREWAVENGWRESIDDKDFCPRCYEMFRIN